MAIVNRYPFYPCTINSCENSSIMIEEGYIKLKIGSTLRQQSIKYSFRQSTSPIGVGCFDVTNKPTLYSKKITGQKPGTGAQEETRRAVAMYQRTYCNVFLCSVRIKIICFIFCTAILQFLNT